MSSAELVVTGSSGFVGQHIVEALSRNYQITTISRRQLVLPETVKQVIVESLGQDLTEFREDISLGATFVHCAAAINPKDNSEYWHVNVQATRELLELAVAVKARQFILFSTGGVYGYRDDEFSKEIDRLHPIGIYGHTKLLSEQLADMYAKEFNLNVVVFRLYFPFGGGQKNGIFPLIKNSTQKGLPLTLNVGGAPKIQPVHCDDISAAVELVIEKRPPGFNVYNLCGDVVLSFGDIVNEYAKARGIVANVNESGQVVGDLLASNELLKSELGWTPKVGCRAFIQSDVTRTEEVVS